MTIETTRFGKIEVQEADILTFPEGMLGFSKLNEYVLVERTDDSIFMWLQAMKKPSIAFPLLEPELFERNYRVELSDEDRKMLELKDLRQAKLYAIITIPSDPTKMTANLKAPIVVNLKNRLARQVILHNADYPIRKSIYAELQQYCTATQTTIFPADEASSYQVIPISEELLATRPAPSAT